MRFLGTFLTDPTDVPRVVVDYVARQLGIADLSVLKGYGDGETRWDHAAEIRRAYGYRDFGDEAVQRRLTEWLDARAWTMGERPGRAVRPRRGLAARAQRSSCRDRPCSKPLSTSSTAPATRSTRTTSGACHRSSSAT